MTNLIARGDPLADAPLLRGASAASITRLRESAHETRLEAREWLFRAGDGADRLFVLLSGRLEVVTADGGVLRELGPGAAVGELGLLTGSPRSASVRAVRDSRLLEIDAERFLALVQHDASFAVAVARELARQLQASGGLKPRQSRPTVFAISAIGQIDLMPLTEGLREALSRWGSVAVFSGDLRDDDFASALEEAEAVHAHVLLVDDGDRAWREFCRRQCDRLLLVAADEPTEDAGALPARCELVLLGAARTAAARWVELVEPRAHHVVPGGAGFASGVARLARRLTQRSLGVVLSGGGARALAHIGAIAALEEAGFEIDRLGGCSMGAFIAGMAAVGYDVDRISACCREELVRRSPFNDYTLPRVALIRSRKAEAMLRRVFADAGIEELERALFTVSADLLSSHVVVHRRGPVYEAVGASMSIPGIAPPLARAGCLLVDGGVLNNLPVDVMVDANEGPVVAVDVVRRLERRAREGGEPALPTIMETLARATVLGSVERADRNRALARLIVAPDVQDIALRDFSQLDRAVDAGRAAAEESLAAGGAALHEAMDASEPTWR